MWVYLEGKNAVSIRKVEVNACQVSLSVADPEGGGGGGGNRRPLKLDRLWGFLKIKMLKNKPQIARESIKTILELLGALSGPWSPGPLPKVSLVPRS